jgi:hypothetical protein
MYDVLEMDDTPTKHSTGQVKAESVSVSIEGSGQVKYVFIGGKSLEKLNPLQWS